MFNFHKKEGPLRSLTGFAGGVGRAFSGGSAVSEPFTAKIVLVGGGGGGAEAQGEGGGGGAAVAFFEYGITLTTAYPIRVGSGGNSGSPAGGGRNYGLDGEYSQWTASTDYRVGEGGNGGYNNNGGNGNYQGGSGGGAGSPGNGGAGVSVPAPLSPYIFGGFNGGGGVNGSGASGGNNGGGGGGATQNGFTAASPPFTPGTNGGGAGGAGKAVPSDYLPDAFTQTDTGPSTGQFLGMLTSQPATLRRTFGAGGGGGSEHGAFAYGKGGIGGGGHGGYGSPTNPVASDYSAPPAGPAGKISPSDPKSVTGEPGYEGRGGGGGGGGYTPGVSVGGVGGGGVCIIQYPTASTVTVGSIPAPNYSSYTASGNKYLVITGNNGNEGANANADVLSGTVTFE